MKDLSVFQTILLVAFGALAISGILVFALVVSSGNSNSIGPITVWGTLPEGAFTSVLRQAAEQDNRFSQVSYVEQDPVEYESILTEALASGTGPDIFLLEHDQVVHNAGKVVPIPYDILSQTQFQKTFIEAANAYLAPGGVLGVPLVADPLVLYWNKDMFSASGFATPPEYWDQLPGIASKIVQKDDAGRILKSAVAFGEYQNVDHAKDIVALLTMQAGGSITERDATGKVVPTLSARTSGPQQATESALRFYTEFADPSKVDYSWNRALPSSRAAFAAGNLAIYLGYASEARAIARTNPNLNFASAPVPQIRGSERVQSVARVYALATSRASTKPNAALNIASLMGDTDFVNAIAFTLDIPAARRDVLAAALDQSAATNPLLTEGVCSGQDVGVCSALFSRSWIDPDPQKTDVVFKDMIESVTSGAQRPAEAIGRATQEMAQIVGQAQ